MNKPDMRLDPLRETWTILAPERLAAPGAAGEGRGASPFTLGNERFAPHELHLANGGESWRVRVVPNRAPALRVEGDPFRHPEGFYDRMDGVGAHEVVIESPDARALEELSLPEISEVIVAWKSRMLDLMRDSRLRTFFIVKDVGELAGARIAHAVSQVFAMAMVPASMKRKLEIAREFYERKKRAIFEDIWREEVRTGTRLVYENNGFAAFCPFASRAPFELAIYPKRQCADFHGLSDQEIAQFADALKTTLGKIAAALDRPAYNLMIYTAPTRTQRRDQWNTIELDFRWHVEILPRLFVQSGIELATGCAINTVPPEIAAARLREVEP